MGILTSTTILHDVLIDGCIVVLTVEVVPPGVVDNDAEPSPRQQQADGGGAAAGEGNDSAPLPSRTPQRRHIQRSGTH